MRVRVVRVRVRVADRGALGRGPADGGVLLDRDRDGRIVLVLLDGGGEG